MRSQATDYETEMYMFYKLMQKCPKLYCSCLINSVCASNDLAKLESSFSFANALNVLGYKHGVFKRFYRDDGRFDHIYYVFNGNGELVRKCNFAAELAEFARENANLECFAADQRKVVQDVYRTPELLQLQGVNYKILNGPVQLVE